MPQIEGIPVEYLHVVQKPDLPAITTKNGSSIVVRAVAFDYCVIVIQLDASVWDSQITAESRAFLVKKAKEQWLAYMDNRYPGSDNVSSLSRIKNYSFSDSYPNHTSSTISLSTV